MKFGFMEDFRNPVKWRRPFPEFYESILDQIAHGEALGYDNVWLTEHHFTEDAYNPSLMPTAAAVAARTSTIRLGTFILIAPYQQPIRIAEDTACVDIFSNGRFDLGLGQGYSHYEFETLDIPRGERGARLRESIGVVKRLFTEESVTHDGRFSTLKGAKLSPKPVQQPHPPLWIGARAPTAIKNAARLGYHLMCTIGPDPAPLYRQTLEEEGRNPDDFNIAQLRMVYCAETEDQAWEDVQDHLFHMLDFYQDILSEANDAEGDDRALPFNSAAGIRHSPFAAASMIGTPDQVAEKMETFCQEYQCTHFIMNSQFPGQDPVKTNRSMELFAKEVMPAFRDR
jgi:alkanesulfonate monooxygenase SsuD/methylene tetrahydromethanopterin reductase-like flavin-dependent oxidoreductase (luciferase family)